jgi:hypothetical protein
MGKITFSGSRQHHAKYSDLLSAGQHRSTSIDAVSTKSNLLVALAALNAVTLGE